MRAAVLATTAGTPRVDDVEEADTAWPNQAHCPHVKIGVVP
ncbi:hypothetical protein [Mycolicibacterium duvalii]|nr:hypothetical protein [Mycolicibacterium duvalii]